LAWSERAANDATRNERSCVSSIGSAGEHTLIVVEQVSQDFSLFFAQRFKLFSQVVLYAFAKGRLGRPVKAFRADTVSIDAQFLPNAAVEVLAKIR
jgi:hypothetical protein